MEPGNHATTSSGLGLDGHQPVRRQRIDRISLTGNLGIHRFCKDGVWELKIDIGPGYRVYYAIVRETIILLLCGGSKKTQKRDIERTVEYRKDYLKRL